MAETVELRLAALTSAQRGLVTYAQAADAGVSERALRDRARRGVLVRVQPRVYRMAAAPPDDLAPVLAAVLSAGGGAVAALGTAAALHGLQRVGSLLPVQICLPQSYADELWDVVAHRTRRLDPCDVTVVDGISCTTVARTLVDLAAVVDRTTLTALVDDAVFGGLVTRRWLHRRATALRSGRKGAGLLVMLTADDADEKFRSWLEREAGWLIDADELPAPRWNEPIRDGGRLLGVADACWPEHRLIAEFDGLRFHSTPDQRRADAERERELVLAGWIVVRFTWRDVVEAPHKVLDALRRALTRGVLTHRRIGSVSQHTPGQGVVANWVR